MLNKEFLIFRSIIKAHLGTHGTTSVHVKPGVTLRDALSKVIFIHLLCMCVCVYVRACVAIVS